MLKGKLTRLRCIEAKDITRYHRWINDPEIARLVLGSNTPISKAQVAETFEVSSKIEKDLYFSIDISSEDKPIGFCFLKNIYPIHRMAELDQFFIGEDKYRQHGYGRDAIQVLLKYTFEELNLNRIWLITYAYNRKATDFYEKEGFIREGILREIQFSNDRYHDGILMAIIREDWKQKFIDRNNTLPKGQS